MSGSLLLTDHDGQQTRLVAGTSAALHSLAAGRLLEARALDDCQLLTVDSAELERLLSWRQALQDVLLQLSMENPQARFQLQVATEMYRLQNDA